VDFRLRESMHFVGIHQFESYGFRELGRTRSLADEAGPKPLYNCVRNSVSHIYRWKIARLLGICRLLDQRRGDFNLPEKYRAALVNYSEHGLHG